MSELLAIGNTTLASATFTVSAAIPVTLYIKGSGVTPPSGVDFWLKKQNADAVTYTLIDVLNAGNIAQKGRITGQGTFLVERQASTVASAGMDKENA